MLNQNPLKCVICGYERGGTTLVAELIRQDPGIDGRFEGGFLLADSLAAFQHLEPYASNLKHFWGLSEADLDYICQASTWTEGYRRLLERSDLPDKSVHIYDKTPRYTLYLQRILTELDVPVIFVARDPRSLFWSRKKRWPELVSGHLDDLNRFSGGLRAVRFQLLAYKRRWDFIQEYRRYGRAWQLADQRFPGRILQVQHERLCLSPVPEARKIYDFLDLDFDESYVSLSNTQNQYVARGGIRADVVWEYQAHLTDGEQKQLLRGTKMFSDWHWITKPWLQ